MKDEWIKEASSEQLLHEAGLGQRLADDLGAALWWAVLVVLQVARIVVCALLVLGEPLVRVVLVPLAFHGFFLTLIFGFLIGDPRFPRWGMLAFSVGSLLHYWGYVWLMSLFISPPRRHAR